MFKVCKTIVDIHIWNGQLKICRSFIFNHMVLHLAITTKWSTMQLNMKGLHIFNGPLHMWTSTIVLQTLNMQGYVSIAYQLKYSKGLLIYI